MHSFCGDPNGPIRLEVTTSSSGASWKVVLRGALDVDSAIALSSQFEQLTSGDYRQVIVDIRGLTALDRAGSAALRALGDRVEWVGADLRVQLEGRAVEAFGPAGRPDEVAGAPA